MNNGVMMQYFEWYLSPQPHLWCLLKEDALHLKNIGITAVWMPPAFKSIHGQNDTGYAIYDMYDLGEFDQKGSIPTKYGTKEEYLQAIEALHFQGIQVYGDIVLNHKMGADDFEWVDAYEVNPQNKNEIMSEKERIQVATLYTFPTRHGKYSDFTWDWTCFNGIDYDNATHRQATFLFEGKKWGTEVDVEHGNFDYLMGADIDFSNENVLKEMSDWTSWYLNLTHLDGFRLDAIKHIPAHFYKTWIHETRVSLQREFFTVGEYWHGDVQVLLSYLQKVDQQISLFDVPLHYHFYEASTKKADYDLRTIFDQTLVKLSPTHAVTFVDNHDTQPTQGLQSWVEEWFKPLAYALILLRKDGYPCVFYGDYYGIPYSHIDSCREVLDMFLSLRKEYDSSQQVDYFDDPHIIGWVKGQENPLVVVMSNNQEGYKHMYVGEHLTGCTFEDCLSHYHVLIDEKGYGDFYCQACQVHVYVRGKDDE